MPACRNFLVLASFALVLGFVAVTLAEPARAASTPHILQRPALSQDMIAFGYADDLWVVPRAGGRATRLTNGRGIETSPAFSPDGKTIAFTGDYDGNTDVFTIPVTGGVPFRVTYHPASDVVSGWTPDGKEILFRSDRDTFSRYTQLYTIPAQGGRAKLLPLPMAYEGQLSPDGKAIAYSPTPMAFGFGYTAFVSWGNYHGGQASTVWITTLPGLDSVEIPHEIASDYDPVYAGGSIYFLSGRDGPITIFKYDPSTAKVSRALENKTADIVSLAGNGDTLVYDQLGEIYLFDTATGKSTRVPIEVDADLPEVRPRIQNVAGDIQDVTISATGVRVAVEAHGEILTVAAKHGPTRDITNTPGVEERTPVWSPDGQSIAYFSDESGLYALHVAPQTGDAVSGAAAVKKFPLSSDPSYYFNPKWSPDSKHLAFNDNQLNIWDVEIASGKLTKVDTDYIIELSRDFAWSADSKWITFSRYLPNRFHAIFVYNLESGKSTQISDGMSDARSPQFDHDGQYLYFTASTNYGPTTSGLDMTSDEHEVTRNVYLAVLPNNIPSPLAPESDEEKPGGGDAASGENANGESGGARGGRGGRGGGGAAANTPPKPVRIDFDKLPQRIVALPVPTRAYQSITAGRAGTIYLLAAGGANGRGGGAGGGGTTLTKFDLKTRKEDTLATGVGSFDLSANGEKMLLRLGGGAGGRGGRGGGAEAGAGPQYVIVAANAPVKAGEGTLHLNNVEVYVDPIAEWKQMYHEVWRIERSYFYDPNLHGVNVADSEKEYEKYLDSLSSRNDLNYIFHDMLSEMTVGHLRGGGGHIPQAATVPGGLLGADFENANGRYRIRKIYTGESWNPQLQGPLAAPGLNVSAGDYILEVNGEELTGKDDIFRLLENTSGKQTRLKVAADATGKDAREITVTPVANEQPLRYADWVEGNRRKVDELSGGKLAYVHMPDTGQGGLTSFTRYYFAQTDREGAVIDERFNSGGQVADYVINVMDRPLQGWWSPRYGAIYRTPAASILGPKVMIINEMAGSGGDMMPWMFRHTKIGTLVGKRTWGGLVGIGAYPALMDGGTVTSPDFGFFNPEGQWDVENKGTPPDVEVEMDPKSVHDGHDPQLERAVQVALEQLKQHPVPKPSRPAFPNYQRPPANGGTGAANGGKR